jgi:Ni/Co efflux regulator RcnB
VNRIGKLAALSTLSAVLFSGAAMAQDDHRDDHAAVAGDHHDNHAYVRHAEWRKGAQINHDDWDRGEVVDYKTYHLKAPPRGYEWREVDGNYVLAAVATGVIASAIIASTVH